MHFWHSQTTMEDIENWEHAHSIEKADGTFKTYCTLHNCLLDANLMGIHQESSVSCDYEDDSFYDFDENAIPFTIRELHADYGDLQGINLLRADLNNAFIYYNFHENSKQSGCNDDDIELESELADHEFEIGSSRKNSNLSLDFFRSKLVEHFDMLFKLKKLVWPKMSKRKQVL